MGETRWINRRYGQIARNMIAKEPALSGIKDSHAAVGYLSSDREKKSAGRTVYAECERVPDKWRFRVPYDFTITVFEPNVERFTTEQLRILLLHELLHVGIEVDGNEERYFVVPHDVEDFRLILDRYGVDWNK